MELISMWKIKTFKTKEQMTAFVNRHQIQWQEVFINNVPYAIEYKEIKKLN